MLLRIRDKSRGSPITSVTVNPLSKVSAIHKLILERTNIDEDCALSLYYKGRFLDPNHPISRYNIHGNAHLDLVVEKSASPDESPLLQSMSHEKDLYIELEELRNEMDSLRKELDQRNRELNKEKHIQEALQSKAEILSKLKDEEIERSVQLHKEKKLLEKKLEDLVNKLQVDDIRDVLTQLAYIQVQWKELGTVLGAPTEKLKQISERIPRYSTTRCLYEAVKYWITQVGATWEALVSALKSTKIRQKLLAEKIEEKFVKVHGQKHQTKHGVIVLADDSKVKTVADVTKYSIFPQADWKVLGMLLGLDDHTLEEIDTRYATDSDRQQAMLQQWINTGQSYWSILVDALDSPILSMRRIGTLIAKETLNQEVQESRGAAMNVITCPYEIDEAKVEEIKKAIKDYLKDNNTGGYLKKVLFAFGITEVAGANRDIDNVCESFTSINFTVMPIKNPPGKYLAHFLKAVSELDFKSEEISNGKCKIVAFYFAGHGGINDQQQPFFVPEQSMDLDIKKDTRHVILMRETILSHFQQLKPDQSFLFFFDCCLSYGKGAKVDESKSFHLEAPVQCVLAYATSVGTESKGGEKFGGKWTSSLCENIKQKLELGEVLSLTHDDVMRKSKNKQAPQYHSCVGPVYLNGKPSRKLTGQSADKTKNILERNHDELLETLSNADPSELVKLVTLLNYNNVVSESVISTQSVNLLGRDAAANIVLSALELILDKDSSQLKSILDTMKVVKVLVGLVHSMEIECKDQLGMNTDMAKELQASHQKAAELETKNKTLNKRMDEFEMQLKSQATEFNQKQEEHGKEFATMKDTLEALRKQYSFLQEENRALKEKSVNETIPKTEKVVKCINGMPFQDSKLVVETPKFCPHHIAVHPDNETMLVTSMWTADIGELHVINKEGEICRSTVGGVSRFNYIRGVAYSNDQQYILVSDQHRIQKLALDLSFVKSVGSTKSGTQPLQFDYPFRIVVHPKTGQVYVAEYGNNRIQVLNADLTFSHMIKLQGNKEFDGPQDISFNGGYMYVAETGKGGMNRITKLTLDGKYVKRFGSSGSAPGALSCPTSLVIIDDLVYVSDHLDHRVSIFNTEGQFMTECFGLNGSDRFKYQDGLATDKQGQLYVCDTDNRRIVIFLPSRN